MFDVLQEAKAVQVCQDCPLSTFRACEKIAQTQTYGVWAGQTAMDRALGQYVELPDEEQPEWLRANIVALSMMSQSVDHIAQQFDVPVDVVIDLLRVADGESPVARRLPPAVRKAQFAKLVEKGATISEMTEALKMTPRTVRNMASGWGMLLAIRANERARES